MSVQKPVIPAFVFVCSWDCGGFAGFCVDVARGFVAARLAVVLVDNAMAMGGAEPAVYPLALDGHLELRDAEVEGFFFFGVDGVVGGAGDTAAAVIVTSSSGGKGGFNLRKEFLEFAVLDRGGPSNMVERPLDNLVNVCGCGRQVVEMGVEISGQVRALEENAGFSVEWSKVGRGEDVVDGLGGCRHYKRIQSPC